MSSTKRNYAYQIFYQILISILPFITSPYISRVLGADSIGVYSYTYSVITYFKIFAALGIANYGNRAIAKAKNNKDELNKTFSSLFALHSLLSLLVIAVYLVYWKVFVSEYKIIALIQCFYLLGELCDINWFYFGMEKFKLTVTRNSILKIVTVIAIFIFVQDRNDLWKYVFIMALGTFLSTSVVLLLAPRYVKFVKFSLQDMLRHVKPMLVLFFAVIAISIFSYMDKIMIASLSNYSELGYYENAWKMIEFPVGFITALGTVMLPKITNLLTQGDNDRAEHYIYESMRFSLFAGIAIAFGIAGISKEFSVVFWGEGFEVSGTLMAVLSVTIVIMSFNSVIRSQYLIPRERDKIYLAAVWVGAVVNFIVNYLLIPQYGSLGAAIGTILAYMAIFLVQTVSVSKKLPIVAYFIPNIPYAIFGVVMFVVVRIIGNAMGYSVLTIAVEVVSGVAVFVGLSLGYAVLFKDTFILNKINDLVGMIKRSVRRG